MITTCSRAALLTLSTGILVAPLLRAQPAPNCEQWNTEEFFRAATVEDVTACLDAGADVAARTESGHTPLHRAAEFNDDPAVIEALLDAGADLHAGTDGNGHQPVHEAATNENPAVLAALLAAGAAPSARDEYGRTPYTMRP